MMADIYECDFKLCSLVLQVKEAKVIGHVTPVVLVSSLVQVQVIPWVISDSNYVRCPAQRLDPSKTVFVGALHGMLNAEALASIMNDLFGGVMYAGIDTDKHKYPIGESGFQFFIV